MKLDDRDIICQQDYAPLSNAELLTQIEENLEWLRGAALFDTERVMGPVRALLARVEAAEARAYQRLEDALFAEQRATDADIRAEETDADASRLRLELAAAKLGISALAARVAELEAQLAARQWRPVTESPHQTGEYIGYDGNIVRCVSYNSDWDSDDDWPWSDIDGIFTPVEMWRPLPPAPQEPTP